MNGLIANSNLQLEFSREDLQVESELVRNICDQLLEIAHEVAVSIVSRIQLVGDGANSISPVSSNNDSITSNERPYPYGWA